MPDDQVAFSAVWKSVTMDRYKVSVQWKGVPVPTDPSSVYWNAVRVQQDALSGEWKAITDQRNGVDHVATTVSFDRNGATVGWKSMSFPKSGGPADRNTDPVEQHGTTERGNIIPVDTHGVHFGRMPLLVVRDSLREQLSSTIEPFHKALIVNLYQIRHFWFPFYSNHMHSVAHVTVHSVYLLPKRHKFAFGNICSTPLSNRKLMRDQRK
jgi:hypothetical protein